MLPLRFMCVVLGAAAAASAQAAPLTYEQALSLAASAPSLRARALSVEAAQTATIAAGRLPDPRLSVGLENLPISGPAAGRFENMTMARIGLMQDVPNKAQRRAAGDIAEAEVTAAQSEAEIETLNVRTAAALAWIDLLYAQKRIAALDEVFKTLEPLVEAAPAEVASGASRPAQTTEPLQWLADLADRRSALEAEADKARAALVRWTGDPQAEVSGPAPEHDVDTDALRAGLEHHPLLTRSAAAAVRAEAELRAARAEARPDWGWQVAYGRRDPMFGDMVSVGASVRLPLFKSTRQAPIIAARAIEVGRSEAEIEAARRELTGALEADLAGHTMHHDQLARARTTLLPLAERRADLETASYGAGTASLGDVFAAFSALADTKLDVLRREAATVRHAAMLNLTYGSHQP